MTIEEKLIHKQFYQTLINEYDNAIERLSERLLEEQKKEVYNLSDIRFAQGEIYFRYKDYETAIFKWEQVENDLAPWAKKNLADAYFQLKLFPTAEALYHSIETKNSILKMEVLLQLFSLYVDTGNVKKAESTIRKALSVDPDYPNVTKLAQNFYEKQNDWVNAINLAINEYMRTNEHRWMDVIFSYIKNGLVKSISPIVFQKLFYKLLHEQISTFEKIAVELWKSYKRENNSFKLLKELNELFIYIGVDEYTCWNELTKQYEKTYFQFINGNYSIQDLNNFMPDLLSVWLKITSKNLSLLAAGAVLAWNDMFPGTISSAILSQAEKAILQSTNDINVSNILNELYIELINWAEKQKLSVNKQLTWLFEQLSNNKTQRILVIASNYEHTLSFIHSLTKERLVYQTLENVILIKPGDEQNIQEIRYKYEPMFVDYQSSSTFLKKYQIALLHVPLEKQKKRKDEYNALYLADQLVYYISGTINIDEINETLSLVKTYIRNIPIHFIVDYQSKHLLQKIHEHVPEAKACLLNIKEENENTVQFFQTIKADNVRLQEERMEKQLFFIRKIIADLFKQRLETESELKDKIEKNEDILKKITSEIEHIQNIKEEKIEAIHYSFQLIRDELIAYLNEEIPLLIKRCSSLVDINHDNHLLEKHLNERVNEELNKFINKTVLPKYQTFLFDWMKISEAELKECRELLLMSEEKVKKWLKTEISLQPDLKIIDDWKRDIDRLCSSISIEPVNIYKRNSFSQLMFMKASKLLNNFSASQWKKKLKHHMETDDFKDIVEKIIQQFFLPFQLFEKGIHRDVAFCLKNPLERLINIEKSLKNSLREKKEECANITNNPEIYKEPLTLFELRLRQLEWIEKVGKGVQYLY